MKITIFKYWPKFLCMLIFKLFMEISRICVQMGYKVASMFLVIANFFKSLSMMSFKCNNCQEPLRMFAPIHKKSITTNDIICWDCRNKKITERYRADEGKKRTNELKSLHAQQLGKDRTN